MPSNVTIKWAVGIFGALCIAIFAVLSMIGVARFGGTSANRDATKNDIKRIMLAMHQYHDANNSFPPAFVVGPDGTRWHSWRALILPYLEPALAEQYRFDEPWNGKHNRSLLDQPPEVYRSDRFDPPGNATNYFAVVGQRTLWPADQPLGIRDIHDGTSNTLAIVENSRIDISWLEPKDLLPSEFYQSFDNEEVTTKDVGNIVGLADGSVRTLTQQIDRTLLNGLLTPVYGSKTYRGDSWPVDLNDGDVEKNPEQKLRDSVSVDTLQRTNMLAASSQEMDAAKNQLWAATFQMAWDELKKQVNGAVVLQQPSSMLEELNTSSYEAGSLSPEASVISVSRVSDTDDAHLLASLKKKFPGIDPPLQEISLQEGQWGIRLYALVRKSMPFEIVFDWFATPLEFVTGQDTIRVNSFGQDPQSSTDGRTFAEDQITILDDRGDDNFIVQLQTTGPQKDKIILAAVPAESTLEATWQAVQERIQHPNPQHSRRWLGGNETLQIPILDFSLNTHFQELEGQAIAGFDDEATIDVAYLDMRLRLDETGAEFVSFAEVGVIGEFGDDEVVEYKPERIRRLILNKPFFIAMQERTGKQPWFMGWIANGELMEASPEIDASIRP